MVQICKDSHNEYRRIVPEVIPRVVDNTTPNHGHEGPQNGHIFARIIQCDHNIWKRPLWTPQFYNSPSWFRWLASIIYASLTFPAPSCLSVYIISNAPGLLHKYRIISHIFLFILYYIFTEGIVKYPWIIHVCEKRTHSCGTRSHARENINLVMPHKDMSQPKVPSQWIMIPCDIRPQKTSNISQTKKLFQLVASANGQRPGDQLCMS